MGELKIRDIPVKEIGTFKNMQQVIVNWEELDKGCVTQNRWDYIQRCLDRKIHIWDHNVALVYLFDKLKAKSYLEIGVLTCGSLVHSLASKTVKRIVGIDPFSATYADRKYTQNDQAILISKKQVDKFKDEDKDVDLIKGLSHPELGKLKEQFDVVLVDGAHDERGAETDLKLVLPKANEAIVMDDIHHPSHVYLEDVAYKFAKEHDLEITVNHQPPGTVIFWVK